jgi:hypothetical protein
MPSIVKLTLESNQYERNIKNAQKSLNDFTRSIGINMKSLSGIAIAAGAVTTALKVAKDAFFSNEKQLDEWGKTVEASKSIYKGFLNALNNGDISGYLSNINTIAKAARAAYDALDELSTFNAFNQVNIEKTRTGMTEAIAGYRMGESSKEGVQAAAAAYKNELQQRQEKEQFAYLRAIRKLAAERGVSGGDLEKALSGSYGSYKELKETMPTGKRIAYMSAGQFGGTMSYEVPVAVTAAEKMGEALRAINDTELQALQALGAQAQRTGNEIANIDKQVARVLNGKGGSVGGVGKSGKGGGGGLSTATNYAAGSIAAQEQLVAELTKKWKEAGAEVRDGYRVQLDEAKKTLQEMMNPMGPQVALTSGDITGLRGSVVGKDFMKVTGLSQEDMPKLLSPLQQINAEIERTQQLMEMSPTTDFYQQMKQHLIELQQQQREFTGETTNDGKNISKSWNSAASAISGVGRAITTIEDPTAKIIGMIAEAVATIALGFSQAIGKDVGEKGNVWYAIGAAAAGITAMISAISSIHSATGYAQGGIVDGKSYSGDNIPILANAGEIVLSKSMQNNLAANLQENGRNFNLSATISGEQIRLVLNNNGRRTGRGEYVTTNFR